MTTVVSNRISAVARLFSSGVITEMSRKGKSPIFARLIREAGLIDSVSTEDLVRDVLDSAFETLKCTENRHEYVYKAALTHKVLLGIHSLKTASMLTEFRVGVCKVDLAIFNGTSTAYEIKSERDSLSRLQAQLKAYREVFAKVYVIAGANHLAEIFASIPSDIGIMTLHDRYKITTHREAADLPERTKPSAIFDAIRLAEAKRILKYCGIDSASVPNTQAYQELKAHFLKLAPLQAHNGMVKVLKQSRNLQPLADLVNNLPVSVRPAALSIPLRSTDHSRLLSAVNSRMSDALNWT
jgi:hypothetical protein